MTEKHFVSVCCEGETCSFRECGRPAEHKVEETLFHDDPTKLRHPHTAYVCRYHFNQIMHRA